MSRHRNVRSMNIDDEYDGYDDVYGHSVEESYCVSPGTVAQFTFNRDAEPSLSSFITESKIPEEDESDSENDQSLNDSGQFHKPQLSDTQQAQLNSCLEEMRNIIGDSVPEHTMVDAVVKSDFNLEKALDQVLNKADAPKSQRIPRERRRDSDEELNFNTDTISIIKASSSSAPDEFGACLFQPSDEMRDITMLPRMKPIRPPPGFVKPPPGFAGPPPGFHALGIQRDMAAGQPMNAFEFSTCKIKESNVSKDNPTTTLTSLSNLEQFTDGLSKFLPIIGSIGKENIPKICSGVNIECSGSSKDESNISSAGLNKFSIPPVNLDLSTRQHNTKADQNNESHSKPKVQGRSTVKSDFTLGEPPVIKTVDTSTKVEDGVARITFSSKEKSPMTFFIGESVQDSSDTEVPSFETQAKQVASAPTLTISDGNNVNNRTRSPDCRADSTGQRSETTIPKSASKSKQIERVDLAKEIEKRKGGKENINLVVIGHVDAGKSTLMGHLLYQLGCVSKKAMHKYEQESKKLGKASFAYAWVLDETEEERTRGVTMDVAQTRFETPNRQINLMDAPGHKDFIPNMITGAAQADVAILVVNGTRGEFETGFEAGGQTREHALLVRSLGVLQIVVAVNKMDTVEWSQDRYNDIVKKLSHFLKQAGFKESDITYVPCSGLGGENLTKCQDEKLKQWYSGPTLVDQIDKFRPPERPVEKPFRMCVADVYKGMTSGFAISGKVEAGYVQNGDRLLIMPIGESAYVKSVTVDEEPVSCALAGEYASVTVFGTEMEKVNIGSMVCDPINPIKCATRIQGRIVVFNIDVPLTKGFPLVFHYQTRSEPAHIRKIVSQLHKSTGEVVKKNPRCLTKNSNAVVEVEVNRPICIELFSDYKDLGRFMLRYGGSTIAAGLVTQILDKPA
ncbi:HBS1-like protein isoform X2 [Tubulanus polymorphus]|uniref:HBS1-like protein isoform X2 n=1 Tax=Tubulanus polymorphus TaxID=672921 RepID=UPI003DA5BBA3